MKNKVFHTAADAIYDIEDGATIMIHAFGGPAGIAQSLILALRDRGKKNITVISCNLGTSTGLTRTAELKPYITPMILVENHQVRKVISSTTIRSTAGGSEVIEVTPLEKAIAAGEVDSEVVPQGILAERIRAGAAGLGGILSPVGIGTMIERGKEKKIIDGKEYILEVSLRADFALVRAYKADKMGNLIYRGTARSFNPLIAMAADITIAEVDEVVEVGEIDAEHIVTPSVFVDRLVVTERRAQ